MKMSSLSMDWDFDGRLSLEKFIGEESTIEKLFKNMDMNRDWFDTSGDDKLEFCMMINKRDMER